MIKSAARTRNFTYAIRNIAHAAMSLEKQGQVITYLNIGDPQAAGFRAPEHLTAAYQRGLCEKFNGYSPSAGLLEAREAVARYATHLGAATTPDDVILTSGASEAAEMVLTALVDAGDNVLLPAPGYPLYPAVLQKLGVEARYYSLRPENGWQPDVEEVKQLITPQTRALLLINPNNPTGSVVPDATVQSLLEVAHEHNLLVIADEVYRDLCFGDPPTSASVFAEERGLPLITLESLSKTHLVPGWRMGWLRLTHPAQMPELVTALHRLAGGRLCAPTPPQYAVQEALEGDLAFQREFMREIRERRDTAVAWVNRIEGLECVTPEAAFYLMVKVTDTDHRTDEQWVLDLLQETGVLVVHGSGFGTPPTEAYFRIVYLPDVPTLNHAFGSIADFMRQAKTQAA